MPDISMCEGADTELYKDEEGKVYSRVVANGRVCEKRDNCYRYTATPDKLRQAYFVGMPINEAKGECLYYMPNKLDKPLLPVIK